jgi:hypothetical protein
MKKNLIVLFLFLLIFGFAGISSAGNLPCNIGNATDFVKNSNYLNGYTQITDDFEFTGEWRYNAIAFKSGNIKYVSESKLPGGNKTFTITDYSNFGEWNKVNFDTANLYFSDGYSENVAPNNFNNSGHFELFQLTKDSNSFSYLTGGPDFSAGTYIVGFNDNTLRCSGWYGDRNFDDIIVAMNQNPVPELATMLLLGSGLFGLAGFGRKKFFKK